MNKQNKIKKSMQAKIQASQEKEKKLESQEPKKGCGCGGGGSSERANLVRRVINIKKKAKP
jgi:hypothetical protein